MLTDEDTEDGNFIELFKKEHNEQFYVLVKMHLSFLLHMTTEESECFYEKVKLRKWNIVPFGKKSKHKQSLDAALNQNILKQVHQLINFLKLDSNLNSEGIFRRTGSLERQNELKNLLLQGCTINFSNNHFTVHDCASVLKWFLADLPEPITTDIQFPIYCQIAESFKTTEAAHEIKILQSVQLLFLLLPKENKNLLQDIFELLHLVMLKEDTNRMSSENLAKLFTPHLLCPRKLAPEVLLKDSQILFSVVAFMIKKYPKLFKIPAQLMLDFRTHHEQGTVLNDSIKGAAHTVFSFVDNNKTAKENQENVTDAALAELYAHIQSLPETSKKRKLVKQFNKQNGQGTPLQVIRSSAPKNRSFGDSIKKHMFHKKLLKNVKKSGLTQMKSSSSEEVLNETMMTPRSRKPVLLVSGTNINNLAKLSPKLTHLMEEDSFNNPGTSKKLFVKSKSDGDLNEDNKSTPLKLNKTDSPKKLSHSFKNYMNSRDMLTIDNSPTDSSFSSRSDDFQSYTEFNDSFRDNRAVEEMSDSMLYILDGNSPNDVSMENSEGEKKLVLKPRQFDENGKPIVFETSF
ncbi:unnamed protein product [Ceutorhynchus assimilis]|uniref:Rho-GAP domain-containing protein n=1 Tax=Ceutorhynchus assimilis TaxID=467358 RepID=A0A9P0GT46_9CUCU|nr:unnamed protein product [Ceutorhynchus assimilis]